MDISLVSLVAQHHSDCSDPYIYYSNIAASLSERHIILNKIKALKPYRVYAWQGANKVLGSEYSALFSVVGYGYGEISRSERIPILLAKRRADVVILDRFIFNTVWQEMIVKQPSLPAITLHNLF
ncbi:MAG: hypothetical protein HRU25_04540 [Psychrobium sp.]|nr:hypothetical protein [Psychrobium sp.]